MNRAEEVAGGLVVASRNGAVLLEFGEEVLDEVAGLVQVLVMAALLLARAARWNHHRFASLHQRLDHASLSIVGLVGNDGVGWRAWQQRICTFEIVSLSWRQVQSRGITQRIDRGMDFRAQSAPAAPDGLSFRRPPFAPALCWWARTMVESIIAYSLSASCANASNTRRHTPDLLHRECRRWTTRKSPKRSGRSHHAIPARYLYSTASTNNLLSLAVTPTWPSRPGSMSLIRSHWSSLNAYLRPIGFLCCCRRQQTPEPHHLMTGPNAIPLALSWSKGLRRWARGFD